MDKIPSKWIRNENDELAISQGCTWDERAGIRVVDFCRRFLRHSTGRWAGKPFELLPWQVDNVVMPLFSWKNTNGFRRFRTCYGQVAKKNGKSTLCAGLALYGLVADGEPSPEVYLAAADKDQAGIVFTESAKMAKKSPAILNKVQVIDSRKRIVYMAKDGFIRVLTGDAFRSEGINVHFLVFDELHTQKNRLLWDALRYGGAARTQPLSIAITTAGFDKNSICYEQYEYAKKVQMGVVPDTTFFSFIYEPGEKDDWKDEVSWYKANPSLGETIDLDSFKADILEAKESPTKENSFKRYRLDIWTEQETRWIDMDKWKKCHKPFNLEMLKGQPCTGGLDMSNVNDVTAFTLYFQQFMLLLSFFWVPLDTAMTRERKYRVPYATWIKQGFIRGTPGDTVDYHFVKRDIIELGRIYKIHKIGADPFNATQLLTELTEQEGFNVLDFRQGFVSMNAPSKEFERLIGRLEINHLNNPVLNWMASHVSVEIDAVGNYKPSKEKSMEKIDGIVSSIMSIGVAMVDAPKKSIYEERGIRRL